ncbi:hypothetical protein CAL14_08855 [Bordetella genomosp. 9]|uniref:hypothetical protein n=1 Tax=Bordetella genomosp. 9 TaxID=1416803 RepID=UPI000A294A39|nr:hypothetical protein [Bordetella genomosp. 9]ARP90387.1 hypothetical protein CAL14_08855 [Bordetella genomosp. 9]
MSITSTAVTRSVCHPGTLSGDEQGNGKLDEMTKKFAAVAAVADEAAAAPTVARMDEHRASVLIDSHGLTPAGRTDPAASSETSKLVSRVREDDSSAGWLDWRISELERLEKEGRLGQHPPADRQAYEQWKMGNNRCFASCAITSVASSTATR